MVHNLYSYLISNCNPTRTIRVNRTETLFIDVAFIRHANNCYAVYPVIRAVMQTDSYTGLMQNTAMRHADYRHPGYRCASHTLQLAVLDSLKLTTASNTSIMARKVVKCLCNQTVMMCIRQLKLKKPILDCKTRWGSSSNIVGRLLKLRDFCDKVAEGTDGQKALKLSEHQWKRIHSLCGMPLFRLKLRLLSSSLNNLQLEIF